MAEVIGALVLTGVDAAAGGGGLLFGGGGLAGSTLEIFGATLGLNTIVGGAVILGATIGLQYALRPQVPKAEDGSVPIKQAVPPRILGYGRNRLAGYYMMFEVLSGNSFDVMAFHHGRVEAIETLYLHDDEVTLGAPVGPSQYATGQGSYYSKCQIAYRLGLPSQAAYFAGQGTGTIWTSDFKGNGIASASLVCEAVKAADFGKYYPRGLPTLSVVARCSPIWDPRDPTQSRADSSTWVASRNPVIQILDYLWRSDGGLGIDFDAFFPADRIARWMIEADLCDELVDRADGSQEPRYCCDGWFTFDTKPEDVINKFLSTCDGWMMECKGGFELTVGVYREPTVTIESRHLLGSWNLQFGDADEAAVNQVETTYTEPASKYVETSLAAVRDENAISLSGTVRPQKLDLPWVQSATQGSRLAYRALQRLNPGVTGTLYTTLYGALAEGKRWVRVNAGMIPGLGDGAVIEITGYEIDDVNGRCTFNWLLINAGAIEAYDPAVDEPPTPVIPEVVTPIGPADVMLLEDASFELLEDGGFALGEDA